MISEMTVYCKDSLKMNVLREVLAGEMTLTFRMDEPVSHLAARGRLKNDVSSPPVSAGNSPVAAT